MARQPGLPEPGARAAVTDATGLQNLLLLIQLRWIAVLGQIVTIEAVHYSMGIALPLQPMLVLVAVLVAFNLLSLLRWRTGRRVRQSELLLALLVDVGILTAQLYLSGGTTNPLSSCTCCKSPWQPCCCGTPTSGSSWR